MNKQEIIQICQKICNETNKYNKHSHELFHIYEKEIFEFTEDLVPKYFSNSKRIEYIIELQIDPEMKTRYVKNCDACDIRFNKPKKFSYLCPECSINPSIKFCKKHYLVYHSCGCPTCNIEKSHKKYTIKNTNDWIECGICSFRGGDLGSHITKIHNITTDSYLEKYNIRTVKSQSLCDKVSGENNPAYQHGGKFSPFSEKFIYADTTNREELVARATKTRADNDNNTTTIEYWLKNTDGDLEEAQKLLTERQTTFSLNICIEKHGQELGREVWLERQYKWQDNINSKSPKELEEINKKKSNSMSYSNLWTNRSIFDGKFYLLDLNGGLYKIGITSRSIRKRYSRNDNYKILIEFDSSINHCFQIEQLLKQNFYKDHIIPKSEAVDGFGWTETLKNIDLDDLLNTINTLSNNIEYTTKLFKETFNLNYAENF